MKYEGNEQNKSDNLLGGNFTSVESGYYQLVLFHHLYCFFQEQRCEPLSSESLLGGNFCNSFFKYKKKGYSL